MKTKFITLLLLLTLASQISKGQENLRSLPGASCSWVSPKASFNILADCYKINKCDIKYYIKNGTDDVTDENEAIALGFAAWADLTDLKFTRTNIEAEADITLEWGTLSNTAEGNTLCTTPRRITFKSSAKWNTNVGTEFENSVNLNRMAIHEIGHALGLDHSNDDSSIMYPVVTNISSINNDDKAGIIAIYGPKTGPIVGPKHLCVGNSATYSRKAFGTWYSGGGVEVTSLKTESFVTVKAISSTQGLLGTSQCETLTIFTTVNQPGAILGTSQICPGEGEGYYTISPVASASSYIWSASDPAVVLHINAAGTACTATGITKNFILSVKAKNPCGTSPATTKTITKKKTYGPPCNGEDLIVTKDQIVMDIDAGTLEATIYPNPATQHVNLNVESTDSEILVSIYHAATGVKTFAEDISGGRSVLDVSFLPKGNYIIVIENNKHVTKKLFQKN